MSFCPDCVGEGGLSLCTGLCDAGGKVPREAVTLNWRHGRHSNTYCRSLKLETIIANQKVYKIANSGRNLALVNVLPVWSPDNIHTPSFEWCQANHRRGTKWRWRPRNSKNNQKTNAHQRWHCPGRYQRHEKVLFKSSAVHCSPSIALEPKKARIS